MRMMTKKRFEQFSKRYRAFCIYSSLETMQYFFTTDHCQSVIEGTNVPKDFCSCTVYLPINIVPRASCPSGIVDDLKTYLKIFHDGEKEVENPDPDFRIDRADLERLLGGAK